MDILMVMEKKKYKGNPLEIIEKIAENAIFLQPIGVEEYINYIADGLPVDIPANKTINEKCKILLDFMIQYGMAEDITEAAEAEAEAEEIQLPGLETMIMETSDTGQLPSTLKRILNIIGVETTMLNIKLTDEQKLDIAQRMQKYGAKGIPFRALIRREIIKKMFGVEGRQRLKVKRSRARE